MSPSRPDVIVVVEYTLKNGQVKRKACRGQHAGKRFFTTREKAGHRPVVRGVI